MSQNENNFSDVSNFSSSKGSNGEFGF